MIQAIGNQQWRDGIAAATAISQGRTCPRTFQTLYALDEENKQINSRGVAPFGDNAPQRLRRQP